MKVIGLFIRSLQLYRFARNQQFSVAVSHGSPFQILAAFLLRIPSITLHDYEHAFLGVSNTLATRIAIPKLIPDQVVIDKGIDLRKVVKYPGLKEEVYLGDFEPDDSVFSELHLDPSNVIVTLRPPATEAHYHHPQSEQLLAAVITYLLQKREVTLVVFPRGRSQQRMILTLSGYDDRVMIPAKALNGLNMIWHSDLVISGGGTMNREAAALGVPVYSIFRGPIGSVDRYLARSGKLCLIETVTDISKIRIEKRKKQRFSPFQNGSLKSFIAREILATAAGGVHRVGSESRADRRELEQVPS